MSEQHRKFKFNWDAKHTLYMSSGKLPDMTPGQSFWRRIEPLARENGEMQPNSESADYDLNLEPDDGEVGNDGLTDKQRATLTKRYQETIGNPHISAEAIKEWKVRRLHE